MATERETPEVTPRTEMKCARCGGFSSTRVCWHCSNLPDAISFLEVERLQRALSCVEERVTELAGLLRETKDWMTHKRSCAPPAPNFQRHQPCKCGKDAMVKRIDAALGELGGEPLAGRTEPERFEVAVSESETGLTVPVVLAAHYDSLRDHVERLTGMLETVSVPVEELTLLAHMANAGQVNAHHNYPNLEGDFEAINLRITALLAARSAG